MKNIILALLIATTFSCNVIKNFRKEKSKEEVKTETEVKLDSVADVEIEQEIISTFISDSTAEILDLSTETITILFNDSGVVKSIITTKKNNIKSKVKDIDNNKIIKNENILSKVELSKVGKSKTKHELSEVKKGRKVEKTSLPNWLWWLLIITGVVFALVAIWKVKKNNFTQFFK